VRFYLIATHYRSPLDFDDGKLEEARKALGRLKTTLTLASEFMGDNEILPEQDNLESMDIIASVNGLREQFIEAMDDDFNTARALGYLFEMAHQINAYMAGAESPQ